jgi:hypothetical protein
VLWDTMSRVWDHHDTTSLRAEVVDYLSVIVTDMQASRRVMRTRLHSDIPGLMVSRRLGLVGEARCRALEELSRRITFVPPQ